jgi:tripartite-type tricarboxylate transporter receptor subunit TctC
VSTHAVNPHLFAKMPYDALKDFAPVTLVAVTPNVLVVNPAVNAGSVKDLIALAKATPGKLDVRLGQQRQRRPLSGELFKTLAGIDIVHVPYKGGAPRCRTCWAVRSSSCSTTWRTRWRKLKAGKLKAFAVTTAKRSALAP